MKKIINWRLPIRLRSEANNTDHWTKKRKRFQAQKDWIGMRWRMDTCPEIPVNCIVVFTRIAPRELDDDNLRMAFKHIKDYVAVLICPDKNMAVKYTKKKANGGIKLISYSSPGRADDCKTIEWNYKQEKEGTKDYAVKIEVFIDD